MISRLRLYGTRRSGGDQHKPVAVGQAGLHQRVGQVVGFGGQDEEVAEQDDAQQASGDVCSGSDAAPGDVERAGVP